MSGGKELAPGSELEVEVESIAGEMTLRKVGAISPRRALDLREPESAQLLAQLTEDPSLTSFTLPGVGVVESSGGRMQQAIARNLNREQLIWFGIDGGHRSAALGDRIIVRRDTLESEYVCPTCKGKGHGSEICAICEGRQQRDGVPCTHCQVLGFDRDSKQPSGYLPCGHCHGSGWRNGIVVPEIAQTKPVTGVVVSLGPNTQMVKLGDRVLHSRFAGHELVTREETFTFMREVEVISLLRDL